MTQRTRCLSFAVVVLMGLLVSEPAYAAVSVSRAELSGSRLRLEGTAAANRDITADGVVLGRSDGSGAFRVERDPFTAPADCTVDVGDGLQTAPAVPLAGCTVSTAPPPTPPPDTTAPADTTAPSVPVNLVATVVGTTVSLSWDASTDNVAVTGYRVFRDNVLRATPTGTTFSDADLAAGTYTYTVAAFDAAGNTSTASAGVSATVAAPAGLAFITPAQLPDATVGQAYLAYIVVSDPPGPSTFKFKLVSGKVPPGTRFSGNTLENRPEARVSGTPTTAGTSSFTVEVQDNTGATVRRTFSVRVLAG